MSGPARPRRWRAPSASRSLSTSISGRCDRHSARRSRHPRAGRQSRRHRRRRPPVFPSTGPNAGRTASRKRARSSCCRERNRTTRSRCRRCWRRQLFGAGRDVLRRKVTMSSRGRWRPWLRLRRPAPDKTNAIPPSQLCQPRIPVRPIRKREPLAGAPLGLGRRALRRGCSRLIAGQPSTPPAQALTCKACSYLQSLARIVQTLLEPSLPHFSLMPLTV